MIFNYITLAFRLLIRNPFFTIINVLGLSIGFAVFFILWQYSQHELKSDQFHKGYDQIYKLGVIAKWGTTSQEESILGVSAYRLPDVIEKYTQITEQTKFFGQQVFSQAHTLGHGTEIMMSSIGEKATQNSFLETKVIYAEPNFFSFFSFPLVRGNPQNVLKYPDGVVISENTATKYFGLNDPVGKTIVLNNSITLLVTGVFKNLPHNTHLDFDFVISTKRISKTLDQLTGGERFLPYTYIKFPSGTNIEELQRKINRLSKEEVRKQIWGDWALGKGEILLQPLKEVPYESYRFDIHKPKSKYLLHIFGAASFIILMMGWINYINLTVSSSNKRMKEIAARKTVGARTKDFVNQFIVEAVIVNITSFLLALTFVQLFKSPADIYLQFYIPPWSAIPLSTWIIILSVLLIGILMTGLYPALITLKKSPQSLFNSAYVKTNENGVNWILTTIQFTGALILIIWVFAIHSQLTFILDRDIGLNRNQVLIVDLPIIPSENFSMDIDHLTKRVSALPGISGYTVSNNVSAGNMGTTFQMDVGKGFPHVELDCSGGVDENFIPFYNIKLLAGRNFQPDKPSDKNSILISRGAALRLGITKPEEVIGLRVEHPACEIIGVFEDYTLRPLIHDEDHTYGGLPGVALTYKNFLQPDLIPRKISFRMTSVNFEKTIEGLAAVYSSVFPGNVFNWYFLEDQINNQYQSDRTARNQIFFFSVLAIGIACLGLLGMICDSVVKKVKEIGIRKVLGARLHHIAQVLLSATIKQIVVAAIISIPLAYFLTQQYLEKFTERITLQWWHYMIPLSLMLVIMFATIASVLYKAAKTNPVESLRYE